MALSQAQRSAYNKLDYTFRSAASLGLSIVTLNALVSKGYASRRAEGGTFTLDPNKTFYCRKD